MSRSKRDGRVYHPMQPIAVSRTVPEFTVLDVLVMLGLRKARFNCWCCNVEGAIPSGRVAEMIFGSDLPHDFISCSVCGSVTGFPKGSIVSQFAG